MKFYKNTAGFSPKGKEPANIFQVSCIPWSSLTGFDLKLYDGGSYLLPIFTIGKYFQSEEKIMLPFSIRAHRSVFDGFQVCRFFNEMQNMTRNLDWLKKS